MSFRNGFLETPFLVAIDRSTSSVVVTIRGTLSMADVITDLVSAFLYTVLVEAGWWLWHCGRAHDS